MGEFRDIILVVQLVATFIVGLFMKFFYSELKQRDIKISNLDERLAEVEQNYVDRFDKVYLKQDKTFEIVNTINVELAEMKQMVKDQKEFCHFVQDKKNSDK